MKLEKSFGLCDGYIIFKCSRCNHIVIMKSDVAYDFWKKKIGNNLITILDASIKCCSIPDYITDQITEIKEW